jgi:hypothetical protein
MVFLFLFAMPLLAQDLDSNFEKMLSELNRNRFDKALVNLFPIQSMLREKTGGKFPELDAGERSRMREMDDAGAVLSTIALLRSQVESKNYEPASVQAMLVGMGLSGLWMRVPAYKKLNFAKEDLEAAPPPLRDAELKKVGYAAIDASEWELAKKTAADLIASTEKKSSSGLDLGALRHSALTIRGLAELGQGNLAAAEKSLVDSMKVKGEMMLRNSGPNFRLAEELLAKGRKQAVDQFLVLVGESVWRDSAKAAEWRKDLAAGKEVDFGRYNGGN